MLCPKIGHPHSCDLDISVLDAFPHLVAWFGLNCEYHHSISLHVRDHSVASGDPVCPNSGGLQGACTGSFHVETDAVLPFQRIVSQRVGTLAERVVQRVDLSGI